MYTHNVTPEAISTVRQLISQGVSIRKAAISAGISYYAAYVHLKGKRPQKKVSDGIFDFNGCHPVTGFPLEERIREYE